jgi:MSHA biogenesis protein MshL
VQKFLDTLRRSAMTQILIEAKVLEVALTDEFAAGINWGAINFTGLSLIEGNFAAQAMNPAATSAFTATLNLKDLDPVISALSRYGTVRALSSPRVTVMNNQPAVVNVAENKIYFEIDVEQSTTGDPPVINTTFTTTQKSAPEGVLMNVVPTANADTGEIVLAVRPTVSKEVRSVEDPTIKLNFPDADIANLIPQLSVQEIDSIIKMQSGQTMVMGGLMRDQNIVSRQGMPVLGDVPMLGAIFRNHSDRIQKSELVIFLKATIMPGSTVDEMDRRLYKSFGKDRRPAQL